MGWTLADIRNKVRSVTGTPSSDQLTDSAINNYINNYYVLTMPFELKEQIQNNYLKFKTVPGQDVYSFPSGYFTDSPGAYADGFPLVFYQDPDIYFQDWPQQYAVDVVATGDGTTATFTGGAQNPPIVIGSYFITDGMQVLQDQGNSVTQNIAIGSGIVSYSGTLGVFPIEDGSLSITDGVETFVDNAEGILTGSAGGTGTIDYATGAWSVTFSVAVVTGTVIIANYLSDTGIGTLSGDGAGSLNYITGAFSATFNNAPPSTATIYDKYIGYSANRPQGVLFFNNQFTLRPVPDQVYQILMQGFINPIPLNDNAALGPLNDTPMQMEWGQVIAYGASLDIFTDRADMGNYDRFYPIFKRFENVALGRTIQQYTAEQSVPRF